MSDTLNMERTISQYKLHMAWMFPMFVLLNVFDCTLTTFLIKRFGFIVELNPIIHSLLAFSDTCLILWLWKLMMLLLVGRVVKHAEGTKHETSWKRIMIFANMVMVLVVAWGAYVVVNA